MKHFRKVGKKGVVTKMDVIGVFNEFKAAVQNFAGMVNHGQVPTILDAPRITKPIHDEPLSFEKMKQDLRVHDDLPTFQDFLNGMANLAFADDKEDYGERIKDATHLTEKQRNLLLTNLWAKR